MFYITSYNFIFFFFSCIKFNFSFIPDFKENNPKVKIRKQEITKDNLIILCGFGGLFLVAYMVLRIVLKNIYKELSHLECAGGNNCSITVTGDKNVDCNACYQKSNINVCSYGGREVGGDNKCPTYPKEKEEVTCPWVDNMIPMYLLCVLIYIGFIIGFLQYKSKSNILIVIAIYIIANAILAGVYYEDCKEELGWKIGTNCLFTIFLGCTCLFINNKSTSSYL